MANRGDKADPQRLAFPDPLPVRIIAIRQVMKAAGICSSESG